MSVDLDELEHLLAEATPGPWEQRRGDPDPEKCIYRSGESHYNAVLGESACGCGVNLDPNIDLADARCIIALRNAAPELIAEIRSLRVQTARLVEALEYALAREVNTRFQKGCGASRVSYAARRR